MRRLLQIHSRYADHTAEYIRCRNDAYAEIGKCDLKNSKHTISIKLRIYFSASSHDKLIWALRDLWVYFHSKKAQHRSMRKWKISLKSQILALRCSTALFSLGTNLRKIKQQVDGMKTLTIDNNKVELDKASFHLLRSSLCVCSWEESKKLRIINGSMAGNCSFIFINTKRAPFNFKCRETREERGNCF